MGRIAQLFSFRGRTSRRDYWRIQLLCTAVLAVFWCVGLAAALATGVGAWSALGVVALGVLLVVGMANFVRRLHDRNKSAWWMAPFYGVPILGGFALGSMKDTAQTDSAIAVGASLALLALSVWVFIDLGCLRGTRGANRYGPDPVGG